MADDLVSIYNQALSSIGMRSSVSSPTEASLEREVCELWFSTVRDQVLRAAPWTSAEGYRRLALVKERDPDVAWAADDPRPGARYAYVRPSDMIWPRQLSNFAPFSQGIVGGQRCIFTDVTDAILVYTLRLENIGLWDSGLRMSVVYGLAAAICMKLTGKRALALDIEAKANQIIIEAREVSANAEVETYESIPEWFTARGYGGSAPTTRYVYPSDVLLQNVGGISAS